jgi:hypothetical protein
LHNRTGEDAYPERSDRNTDAYLKRIASGSKMCIMGREVVVTVTNGRLDGSTELAEVFGTWERILGVSWIQESFQTA